VLDRQVEEKKSKQSLAKSQEKIIDPQRIYKFVENYDSCYKCHKLYPTKALNLASLKDARLQKKLENKDK